MLSNDSLLRYARRYIPKERLAAAIAAGATIFNYCSNRGNMPLLRYGSGLNAAGMIHCYATFDATFRRSGLQTRLLRWPQFLTIAAIASASRSYGK